jgi:hypothetical protein
MSQRFGPSEAAAGVPADGTRRRRPRWPTWLGLAVALIVINAALTFHNRWPTPWISLRPELSPELAMLVLLLAVAARHWGPPTRRLVAVLAIFLTLLALGRYAEVTAPALYGRTINLFWDARHLPGVVAMLAEAAPAPLVLAGLLGLLLGLGTLYALLHWALVRVGTALARPASRRLLVPLASAALAVYLIGMASPQLRWERAFSAPVTWTYARQAAFLMDALGQGPRTLPPSPPMRSDLGRVQGAHVAIVFAESYGAATFDQPRLAEVLSASRAELGAALAETGRAAVSAFVHSSTFGGNSWLAHASLLSGVEVREGADYALLLTQRRETLVHRFARAGYRTLAVMPGLRKAWPEGAFYGFDAILDAHALDYRGPAMGWWRIPDQFSLIRLDRAELAETAGRPRFVVFPTIGSHMPFRPRAPLQPDWARLLGPEPFDAAPLAAALEAPRDLMDLGQPYAESLDYLFRILADWLRRRADLDLVLLVLGDHQPPAAVSGEAAGWEVPVHLIAGRATLLEAFVAEGFVPGLSPRRPALGNLPDLTEILLRAFDSGRRAVPDFRARASRARWARLVRQADSAALATIRE